MVARLHRKPIRADLVRGVAVRGDPVGAGEHRVDLAGRHERRRGGVDDHRVRDAGRLELPRRQPRTLEQRPRLVDPDVREQIALPRGEQGADSAAVPAGREAARVAVRQRARARAEQPGGVGGHAPAALDLVGVDRARVLGRRIAAHLVERPAEIDRRRPRLAQHPIGLGQVLPTRGRERIAVGGGDPDRRRAAHHHRPDRVGHLGRRAALDVDLLERQEALVEEDDAVVLEAQDPLRLEHARSLRPSSGKGCAA